MKVLCLKFTALQRIVSLKSRTIKWDEILVFIVLLPKPFTCFSLCEFALSPSHAPLCHFGHWNGIYVPSCPSLGGVRFQESPPLPGWLSSVCLPWRDCRPAPFSKRGWQNLGVNQLENSLWSFFLSPSPPSLFLSLSFSLFLFLHQLFSMISFTV